MENIDRLDLMVLLQDKNFVPVTSYASRQEEVVEHSKVVELEVVDP